jgi:hypothetical protein
MSSEKQNEGPAWKEGLLQWESSGGPTEPGENMLWDKLQDRLQPARNKKRVYFFRVAAILLFLLAAGFLLLQKPRKSIDPVVIVTPAAPAKEAPELKKVIAAPVTAQPALSENKLSNDKIKHTDKKPEILSSDGIITPPEEEKLVIVDPVPEIVQQQEPAPIPFVTVPQKKKLRVVHLNDLNNLPPPTFASMKDEWNTQQSIEEITSTVPSIWPGKHKPKPPVQPGN